MLPTLLSNPQQQVMSGLLGGFSPYPQASVNAAPQTASLTGGMGPWSQLAYQMAGSPKQGGAYAQVTPPPTPVNTNAAGAGGGSTAGSIATGLLGAVLKNPQLLKGAYNGIAGLLGGGGSAAGSVGSILAGGSPTLSAVGTGAVAPAVNAAGADAAAALSGADAAGGAAAGGVSGLLGSSAGTGAGSIASGTAAAGQTGTAAGSLGVAGAANPLAAAAIPFLIGMSATKKTDQGNEALKAWMQATGATWKGNPAAATQSNGSTFGNYSGYQPTGNGKVASGVNAGTMYGADGKPMTSAQVSNAIYQWAIQNGVNPGDYHP
jgi:hypothetical protein